MQNVHVFKNSNLTSSSSDDPSQNNGTLEQNSHSQPSLENVLKEFEEWRKNKKHSATPIPDQLWHKVFDLAEIYTELKVRAIFGINTQQYSTKYKVLRSSKCAAPEQIAKEDSPELCEIKIKPTTKKKSSYQPQPLPSAKTLVVEFCRADGRVMKIHTTQDSIPTLMKAFYSEDIQ